MIPPHIFMSTENILSFIYGLIIIATILVPEDIELAVIRDDALSENHNGDSSGEIFPPKQIGSTCNLITMARYYTKNIGYSVSNLYVKLLKKKDTIYFPMSLLNVKILASGDQLLENIPGSSTHGYII